MSFRISGYGWNPPVTPTQAQAILEEPAGKDHIMIAITIWKTLGLEIHFTIKTGWNVPRDFESVSIPDIWFKNIQNTSLSNYMKFLIVSIYQ